MKTFSLFGIKQINEIKSSIDQHIKNITLEGCTILEDVLN